METAELIESLRSEGSLLADAAERAGSEAEVPTCPEWRVRDLVRHTGTVHRWATAFVAEGLDRPRRAASPPDLDGAELLEWFREGHARLVDALLAAPDDLKCWAFLPAPSPLAFWARRQAHETTVHRVDAEAALGGPGALAQPWDRLTPIGPAFALDGIDELLSGFHARERSAVRSATPRTLRVRTTDAEDASEAADAKGATGAWTVRISGDPLRADRAADGEERAEAADCEIAGPAARVYLALWNRLPLESLEVAGDAEVARLWRETSAITFG
ncbi:maleylpyruvate isomerase family mycothiol-dependent enzyme [Streptomyces sp. NPDC048639]|uniref:maleylpyruvate isomerase family mycothiol-dependent enzyme n=1 Tax=Streptomyces sp. NPDC048639 TaxID=3365581 RepID=UPI0037222428